MLKQSRCRSNRREIFLVSGTWCKDAMNIVFRLLHITIINLDTNINIISHVVEDLCLRNRFTFTSDQYLIRDLGPRQMSMMVK